MSFRTGLRNISLSVNQEPCQPAKAWRRLCADIKEEKGCIMEFPPRKNRPDGKLGKIFPAFATQCSHRSFYTLRPCPAHFILQGWAKASRRKRRTRGRNKSNIKFPPFPSLYKGQTGRWRKKDGETSVQDAFKYVLSLHKRSRRLWGLQVWNLSPVRLLSSKRYRTSLFVLGHTSQLILKKTVLFTITKNGNIKV